MALRVLATSSVMATLVIMAACSGGERPLVGETVAGPQVDAAPPPVIPKADGGTVALGGFDPNEMYLQGTLVPGQGGWEVVTRLGGGNSFAAGFDSFGARYGWIHATDGYVYMSDDNAVHKFVADPSPTYKTDGKITTWDNYPKDPRANDPIIPMLPCSTNVQQFWVRPDNHEYLHTCRDSNTILRNAAGDAVKTLTSELDSVGFGGALLLRDAVIDPSGVSHPLDPQVSSSGVAFRAKGDGTFWIATPKDQWFALWNVALDGTATKAYDYGKFAGFGLVNASVKGWIEMDSQARLYRWGYMNDGTDDVIVRFDDKGGELIYDETKVFTKMHASWMITGP